MSARGGGTVGPPPVAFDALSYPCLYADAIPHSGARPYRLTLATYPDRERLTLTYAGLPFSAIRSARPSGITRDLEWRVHDNERRSIARARQTIEDLCICNRLTYMLTPTLPAELPDDAAVRDVTRGFLSSSRGGRAFRRWMGPYVGVAGASVTGDSRHVHLAVGTPPPRDVLQGLQSSWTEYLASAHGIGTPATPSGTWRVDVAAPTESQTTITLGAYLSRHITSTSGPGQRYLAPKGMARPVTESQVVWLTGDEAWERARAYGEVHRITRPDSPATLGLVAERPLSPASIN